MINSFLRAAITFKLTRITHFQQVITQLFIFTYKKKKEQQQQQQQMTPISNIEADAIFYRKENIAHNKKKPLCGT